MINTEKRPLRVFLCHSSGDKPIVRNLYAKLLKDGFDVWLDEEKLIAGQEWRIEIPKAVKNSDVVLVCLSSKSITKEGFVQKEIRLALDAADEKPDGTIFFIPVRLEECDIPERIGRFHWVDIFLETGYERLLKALRVRAENIELSQLSKSNSHDTANKIVQSKITSNAIAKTPPQSQNKVETYAPAITQSSENKPSELQNTPTITPPPETPSAVGSVLSGIGKFLNYFLEPFSDGWQ